MIEPEDMARFRRHVDTMLRMAADDAASFAQVVGIAQGLEDGLADAAALCRREGFSFSALGEELGTMKSAAHERFGMRPRPVHVDVARRRLAAEGLDPDRATRLTVLATWGDLELAGPGVWASQERGRWVRLRTCATAEEAEALAAYMEGRVAGWRLVRRPHDLPQWAEVSA